MREREEEREGRASVNNESIDPPPDDGSGCHGDRCSDAPEHEEDASLPRTARSRPGNGVGLGMFFCFLLFIYIKRGDAGSDSRG